MGYFSRTTGEICFAPNLPRYAVRGNEVIHRFVNDGYDLFLDPDYSIIFSCEHEFKAYNLEDNLRELVAEILKINPDTTFYGHIEVQGEGDGVGYVDLYRYIVKGGQVKEIRPNLVWPED